MRQFLSGFLLFFALPVGAGDWTREDKIWESTWMTLHALDMAQTYNGVVRNPDPCFYEKNPLLGREPSSGRLAAYAVGSAALHWGVTQALISNDAPRWARRAWATLTISASGIAVRSNHRMGLRPWGDNKPEGVCLK